MSGAKVVKQLLVEYSMTNKELAERLGISAQSLSNKMNRDSFTYEDMEKISFVLNCRLIFITENGKEFY